MRVCRYCKKEIEPTARQLKYSEYSCNPCQRKRMKEYGDARKAAGNPIRPKTKPVYNKEYHDNYRRENKDRRNKVSAEYRMNVDARPRYLARMETNRAVKSGKLLRQPCEVCGASPAQAHHDDYSKPLDVRWLCPPHHREHHKNEKRKP